MSPNFLFHFRLGVKPRLCRSFWSAFAFPHPLMLPSTSFRETLLACPPSPPCNLPSFSVESTLLHALALVALPLSKAWLSLTLDLSHLVIWTDGSVPFPFGKGGFGVLANCSLCGSEATLSFSAGPKDSGFSAEACAILEAFCWSPQHSQVCQFSSL